jgi:hypothetical protein
MYAKRENERMAYEESLTRYVLRRRQEFMLRQKEILNRSIEDHRRRKEETRVSYEKHQYSLYLLHKLCDHHKKLPYYLHPCLIEEELYLRIEEEERVEVEDRRRALENARWAMEDRKAREEEHAHRVYRKRFAFQELGFHMRLLERLQVAHPDTRIQQALDYYHKEAVLQEIKHIHHYRTQW